VLRRSTSWIKYQLSRRSKKRDFQKDPYQRKMPHPLGTLPKEAGMAAGAEVVKTKDRCKAQAEIVSRDLKL
jgi:hypothetical protein